MKTCKKCDELKAFSEFSPRKQSKDGYYNFCKVCRNQYAHKPKYKERAKKWIEDNKDKVIDIKRKNREKHREKYNKAHREVHNPRYRKNNLEKCKQACNEYKRKNKKELYEKAKIYVKNNKEKIRERDRKYKSTLEYKIKNRQKRLANPEYYKKYQKTRDKAKISAKSHKRRAIKKQAYPNWLSNDHKQEILNIIKKIKDKNKVENIKYHLDHIIPLNHKNVCGLHVPWNLQILTQRENCTKSNKFDGTYENESWRVVL